MRKRLSEEEQFHCRFEIGEIVYPKDNTSVKMVVVSYADSQYSCKIKSDSKKMEHRYFENDLISEWQIPFFGA